MDLPMPGSETRIKLKARRFYCNNEACSAKIFTERFETLLKKGRRVTNRVQNKILKVALLMGGNGGEKICRLANIPVSSSTLIRSVHQEPVPEVETPRVLGLDDWAYKKRLKYGTALVDLEKHKIIELLPDREAATVENWLKAHPQVEIVSRDRYVNYASGVNNALPYVTQVADRWHLIKNLGEAIQKILERSQGALKQKAKVAYQQQFDAIAPEATQENVSVARKQQMMDEVKRLHKQGVSIHGIARQLKKNRATVRNYLRLEVALPKNSPAKSNIFVFEEYVLNAIATRPGVLITELYKEIKVLGFTGKKTVGHQHISKYMPKRARIIHPKELPLLHWRPAQVSLLLYKRPHELRTRKLALVNYLRKESGDVDTAFIMFQDFRKMMEKKEGARLAKWIDDVNDSSIKELQSFALGVVNDFAAVQNALTLRWSNGQVEGQINKLKTIKRQMYGRASFNLLRKRLVCNNG